MKFEIAALNALIIATVVFLVVVVVYFYGT